MESAQQNTAPPVEAEDKEARINRNPHADFAAVEAGRPDYPHSQAWSWTKCPDPKWRAGDGAGSGSNQQQQQHWRDRRCVTIDPAQRPVVLNYKLHVSTTVPRPIALVGTVDGEGRPNLAPFSYWQNVTMDPPTYSISFVGETPGDTLSNILATGECTISMTSDWVLEAMNMASVNAPPGVSEWALSGLTPRASESVRPASVLESPFAAECRLHSHHDIKGVRNGGKTTATLVLLEVVRWHVWEDVLGEDGCSVDLEVMRPVWRAGGIVYGTCFSGFELPRPEAFRVLRLDERIRRLVGEGVGVREG
ncbi:uncharacterized protein PgNI_04401 [Pyricularia grisea]|uniref:Flavin reductase like domain-containing protein n=1 Tax=Pyricularia grisea TaxID=148305 RepID=A0A6P8BB89_PYRGI|nr:uncharacterized protein PgNI_04401 [Pyricularia grisea]TLD13053.1 hypothetical protein PgNI_04401 [Pyricularia grisea]